MGLIFMSNQSIHLRRLVISAMFLAMALAMRYFAVYIPIFGVAGMRVGVSAIFSIPPAILFGPVYGLMVSGLTDLLGHFIRPSGQWLPLMTILLATTGFLRGWFWIGVRNRSVKTLRIVVGAFASFVLLFVVIAQTMLRSDGITRAFFEGVEYPASIITADMTIIGRMVIERAQISPTPHNMLATTLNNFTLVPLIFVGLCLALLVIDFLLSAYLTNENGKPFTLMPLLLTMIIPGLYMNTLNTVILRETVWTSWQEVPFVVVWLPRATTLVLTYIVYTYIVAVLLEAFTRQKFLQPILLRKPTLVEAEEQ